MFACGIRTGAYNIPTSLAGEAICALRNNVGN